jgi:hypothetical protein
MIQQLNTHFAMLAVDVHVQLLSVDNQRFGFNRATSEMVLERDKAVGGPKRCGAGKCLVGSSDRNPFDFTRNRSSIGSAARMATPLVTNRVAETTSTCGRCFMMNAFAAGLSL